MWMKKNSTSEIRSNLGAIYPRLWRYCLVLTKSNDLADDLAQSVCLKALNKAEQFKGGTHLDRWLYRIAHRHWISELRRNIVREGAGVISFENVDIADKKHDPQMNVLGREIVTSIMELPEAQRAAVLLAYVEGYTYKECAEILNVPVGTVMSRLAAARKKLGKKFES